jgi:hypothetical protein
MTARTGRLAALLAAVALLAGPGHVAATTLRQCQAAIATLSLRTQAADFAHGREGAAAQARLVTILGRAKAELEKARPGEALRHLDAYSDGLSEAIRARAISSEDAILLQEGANGGVLCVVALGETRAVPAEGKRRQR